MWSSGCTGPDKVLSVLLSSVQSLSRVRLFATPWTAAHQAFLSITNSQSLLKLMSIALVMPYKHLTLCRPLLLLPSIFPSIRVFSSESVLCIRWPKYWSFSFSISPSSEYSGLISLGWIGWISLQSKGLSRVSPTPQFQSIDFSVLSFLYGPALTSIHDYWKIVRPKQRCRFGPSKDADKRCFAAVSSSTFTPVPLSQMPVHPHVGAKVNITHMIHRGVKFFVWRKSVSGLSQGHRDAGDICGQLKELCKISYSLLTVRDGYGRECVLSVTITCQMQVRGGRTDRPNCQSFCSAAGDAAWFITGKSLLVYQTHFMYW